MEKEVAELIVIHLLLVEVWKHTEEKYVNELGLRVCKHVKIV
jgi:hypothetical protein